MHLLHPPRSLRRVVCLSISQSVTLSDFHCICVSGPSHGVLRPRDVIYFLKAMTNTSFQITILPSVFFPKCGFPRCIFSIAYVSNHNLSPHLASMMHCYHRPSHRGTIETKLSYLLFFIIHHTAASWLREFHISREVLSTIQ